jgi:AcrR family transcriptional regulator
MSSVHFTGRCERCQHDAMNATARKTRPPRADAQARGPVRDHYHHGDLPAALKRAALALIARHGVQGFSLREAAVAVGVSPSAAYRHFADKSALLGAIAADGFVEMGRRFDEAMQSVRGVSARAARARFIAQGQAYVAFALEQPDQFTVMFGPNHAGSSKPSGHADAGVTGPYAALSQVLDELMESGAIDRRRREGAELLAWSAIHGLATLLVSGAIAHAAQDMPGMVKRIGEDCLGALAKSRQ